MQYSQEQLDSLLELAVKVATEAHDGQVDKGGSPYILHPQAVADSVDSTECKIVAWLHDVVEDTSITLGDLTEMGFSDEIVRAVQAITKVKGVSYNDYLQIVKDNETARIVKIADITHNSDISRIPNPTEKDYARVAKYQKALEFLEDAIEWDER